MGKILRYIDDQFSNPRGFIGKTICLGMNIVNKKMYNSVVSRLSGKPDILDIGYGNGNLIKKMYAKTGARIKGIDISDDMKMAATKRNEKAVTKGDIELLTGDCCSLQFNDGMFDVVTTVNTIYFWNDTVKGLREILRVLKEGGEFYNVVYSKEYFDRTPHSDDIYRVFDKEDYIEFGKQAGFVSSEIVDIKPGTNYMVIYKK